MSKQIEHVQFVSTLSKGRNFVRHCCWCGRGLTCDKQTFTITTNVVDNTAYSSATAPSWTRTTVANEHKFAVVKCVSRILLDRSNKAIFTYTACNFAPQFGVILSEFCRDLLRHKIRVAAIVPFFPWSYVEPFWYSAVLWQTDGQTDGRTWTILR